MLLPTKLDPQVKALIDAAYALNPELEVWQLLQFIERTLRVKDPLRSSALKAYVEEVAFLQLRARTREQWLMKQKSRASLRKEVRLWLESFLEDPCPESREAFDQALSSYVQACYPQPQQEPAP
ncbi:hypothetical protein [Leptolyngbya sp. FACHB-261]|uniref:hypothetical protein n=1 Tax=Leptolyngbya sp. FACHB-261 TaxID=2692806 RepID=UPI001683DD1B|nr:hypothetical protein [Leptolyngbya sp. FACHB-261]MBD2101902.1 hypothetical protein [Leptolyngbya sp. FACHB-261]